jgi:hypothetical protein
VSQETRTWLDNWGISLEPLSPELPWTNRHAEVAIKMAKKVISGARGDPDCVVAGLLALQATPLGAGASLAKVMLGRQLRTHLPTAPGTSPPSLTNVCAPAEVALQQARYDVATTLLHPLGEDLLWPRGKASHS